MYSTSSTRYKSEVQKVNSFAELFGPKVVQTRTGPSFLYSSRDDYQQGNKDETFRHSIDDPSVYNLSHLEGLLGTASDRYFEKQRHTSIQTNEYSLGNENTDLYHHTDHHPVLAANNEKQAILDEENDTMSSEADDESKQDRQSKGHKLDSDEEECYHIYRHYTGCSSRKAGDRIRKKLTSEIKSMMLESSNDEEIMRACHILSCRKPDDLLTIEETCNLVTRITKEYEVKRKHASSIVRKAMSTFPKERKGDLLSSDNGKFRAAYETLYKIYAKINNESNKQRRGDYYRRKKLEKMLEKVLDGSTIENERRPNPTPRRRGRPPKSQSDVASR